jgi:hypothetical protein
MAGFIQWLAPRIDDLKSRFGHRVTTLRRSLAPGMSHPRTPEILARLLAASEVFLDFATDVGAISARQSAVLFCDIEDALKAVGRAQSEFHRSADPVDRFRSLLAASINSGAAYVEAASGGSPPNATGWGWRTDKGPVLYVPHPGAVHIGWVEGDDLYLTPDAAYKVAESLARSTGATIGLGRARLVKDLVDQGLLSSSDKDHNTVRRTLSGKSRRVLHVPTSFIDEAGE